MCFVVQVEMEAVGMGLHVVAAATSANKYQVCAITLADMVIIPAQGCPDWLHFSDMKPPTKIPCARISCHLI
jgi:hypothetical protein